MWHRTRLYPLGPGLTQPGKPACSHRPTAPPCRVYQSSLVWAVPAATIPVGLWRQRFFPSTAGSIFFEIQPSSQARRQLEKPAGMSRVEFIQAQANLELDCNLAEEQKKDIWDHPIQIYLKPSASQRYRQMEAAAKQLLSETEESGSLPLQQALDRACLDFSIALLGHSLKGDLFESTVVGFLAVLGVDAAKQTFHEPYGYTRYLSGLVKVAQMLVVERAVQMADKEEMAHSVDTLDAIWERFLPHRIQTLFGWIARLRTYGKKI
ncbi:hypothetical protein AFLA_007362 [Aspergillus flavus NRRL3357]|nr:hypothetical protein AFLA_007362 [Aspergillus flavus NRRL3357]